MFACLALSISKGLELSSQATSDVGTRIGFFQNGWARDPDVLFWAAAVVTIEAATSRQGREH